MSEDPHIRLFINGAWRDGSNERLSIMIGSELASQTAHRLPEEARTTLEDSAARTVA
ncbi:hypothetical protein BN77_p10710 [Rhizobium mesoamericanum STM3625]|uniref:Uncharacterized protein n=1 Tax=Rhizobium mesoamericanum STM3625 TaxID=1211777 RepID=K0Q4H5_9HYPH|nr:hypothetical protein BN77_p10710 [Rhizobium mesoamericanum STM3625]